MVHSVQYNYKDKASHIQLKVSSLLCPVLKSVVFSATRPQVQVPAGPTSPVDSKDGHLIKHTAVIEYIKLSLFTCRSSWSYGT